MTSFERDSLVGIRASAQLSPPTRTYKVFLLDGLQEFHVDLLGLLLLYLERPLDGGDELLAETLGQLAPVKQCARARELAYMACCYRKALLGIMYICICEVSANALVTKSAPFVINVISGSHL